MSMFKAGLAVGAIVIGGIAALMGITLLITALGADEITYTYGQAGELVKQTVTRTGDAARYWQLVGLLGVLPVVLGLVGRDRIEEHGRIVVRPAAPALCTRTGESLHSKPHWFGGPAQTRGAVGSRSALGGLHPAICSIVRTAFHAFRSVALRRAAT